MSTDNYMRKDDDYSGAPSGDTDLITIDVDNKGFVDAIQVYLPASGQLAIEERKDDDTVIGTRYIGADSALNFKLDLEEDQSVKDIADGKKVVLKTVTDLSGAGSDTLAWMRVKESRR